MQLTEKELRALRYYEGDVSGNDPFWGDRKAYLTLNSLLYPGLRNERARTAEGKKLNPAILMHDRYPLLDVYGDLFSALGKGVSEKERNVYRVERHSDYLSQKEAGKTLSFTSTSTAGFLSAYADRIGIALMRIEIPAGVPALDFSEALPEYAKEEEHEILLPPWIPLTFAEIPLSEEECRILDAKKNSPLVSCLCRAGLPECSPDIQNSALLPDFAAGARVYEALNSGKEPLKEDIHAYLLFKEVLQQRLHSLFDQKIHC